VDLSKIKFRGNATHKRGVLLGVGQLRLQNCHRRYFSEMKKGGWFTSLANIERIEVSVIKSIKVGSWPKLTVPLNSLLFDCQSEICRLAVAGNKVECFKLINKLSRSVFIRYIAICRVSSHSGGTPGPNGETLKTAADKLSIYKMTGVAKMQNLPKMEVLQVEIPKTGGQVRTLGISNILDRVLQTQLSLLLDAYLEAIYPTEIYGFRKGRNCLQAVGMLKHILATASKPRLGVLLIDVEKCFDSFLHSSILEHFEVPKEWKPLLRRWLKPMMVDNKGAKLGKIIRGIHQGSVIGPMICNVIIMKALITSEFSKKKIGVFESFSNTYMLMVEGKRKQRTVYRHLISYADDLVITTTNNQELSRLLEIVKEKLSLFGLSISAEKTKIISYANTEKKIVFDYLGFTFLYVPRNKIRKGGIYP